ncbi:hypothetical protein [Skermanella pratensis]|uniref:hypothetical protein n=1 Tax=Skermanella pratensis TaxID=2233999 RepID=UPI001300DA1F|nr:hypothetical protein [Skermanella pratensis]
MKTINWFLAWIERTELAVPVVVQEIRRDGVVFSFEGWPCLRGAVQPSGISVWTYRGEEPWDGVLDIDIHPGGQHGRWICGLCWYAFERSLFPKPPSHPSLEALWTSHSLVPLGDWCSEKLARATGIGLGLRGCCWRRNSSSAMMMPGGRRRSPGGPGL